MSINRARSGEINRRKPSPEIFGRALEVLGVEASRALFVGDTPSLDVKGPKTVGMKSILIKRRPLEKDMDVKPNRIINRLTEVLDVLENFS